MGDITEILARIVGQLAEQQGVDGERPRNADAERVAVRLGLGDRIGAEIAAGARLVLNQERLAELLRQPVRDHRATRSGVDPAPNGT
jgi:hypothetical protein